MEDSRIARTGAKTCGVTHGECVVVSKWVLMSKFGVGECKLVLLCVGDENPLARQVIGRLSGLGTHHRPHP